MTQSNSIDSRHNTCVVVYTRTNKCESGSINVDEEDAYLINADRQHNYIRSNRAITDNFRFSFSSGSSGSPLYNDSTRMYYSHKTTCICGGSGVGCDCLRTCYC